VVYLFSHQGESAAQFAARFACDVQGGITNLAEQVRRFNVSLPS
jgi:hypothetical protein